jgi:erythritol transport system ATP-binding protein
MKILSGAETPTSGRILLDGSPVEFKSPRDAMALGIGIIHQELSLFPNLSIAENMFAGREPRKGLLLDSGQERDEATKALSRLGLSLSPNTLVGELPIGQQQLVEIGRVLSQDVRILIMDEPTSALSNHEVDVLFGVMGDLLEEQVTIIYISHKLDEFRRIGDFVTVLRDGSFVAEAPMTETDTGWIVQQMVGRSQEALFARERSEAGEPLLDVVHLSSAGPVTPVVDDVSLTVHRGEIVGIYGLMGAGRTELLECLMGSRPVTHGEVRVRGELCSSATVPDRLSSGLALVPEDRQRDGLIPSMTVKDNVLLANLGALVRRLLLPRKLERTTAQTQVDRLRVKGPGIDSPITSLSGGNQQKVILGRALLTDPTVLLLDEPTRGIDVGAKAEIAHIMGQLAARGLGVLFISSELVEVLSLADRVLVMARGRITAEFDTSVATEQDLVAASASESVMKVDL